MDELGELFARVKSNIKISTSKGHDGHGRKIQACLGNRRIEVSLSNVPNSVGIKFVQHKASESPEEALQIAKAQNNPDKLFDALINIGDSCAVAGKNKEAITHYQEALAISEEQNYSIETTCELYINIGNQYLITKEHESAFQFYRNVLKIAQNHQIKEQELDALINIGYCLGEIQNYDEAIRHGFEAIPLTEQLQDKRSECLVYRNLGYFYTRKCELQTAIEYQKKALMIAKEQEDEDEMLVLSKFIGETLEGDGQLKEAIPYYERALKVSKETAHKVEETSLHNTIGDIYFKLEEYGKAIECCKESLKLARQFGDKNQEYFALLRIGASLDKSGDSDEAIENYKEALNIVHEQPDEVQESKDVYHELGISYTKLNQPKRALEYQRDALRITQELKDEQQELEILGEIRSSMEKIGQYDEETIEYYSRELELYEQQEDIDNKPLLMLYSDLGSCYKNMTKYTEALPFFEKAFKIAMNLEDRDQARLALDGMAFSYEELGQSDGAIACYLAQIEIIQEQNDPAGEMSVNRNLARHYSKNRENFLSFEYHQNALKIAQQQEDEEQQLGILTDIRFLMEIVDQHDEKAVEYCQKELKLHKKRNDKPNEMALCNSLGCCYKTMKQYKNAASHFEKALEIAKELKVEGKKRMAICHEIAICKGGQGDVELAIKYDIQALDIAQKQGDEANEALLCRSLSIYYRDVSVFQSVQFSQRAEQLAHELGDLDTELEAKRDLEITIYKLSQADVGSESATRINNCSSVPPQLSVTIPKLEDVEVPNKPWKDAPPTDVLLITVDNEEFLSCFFYFSCVCRSYVQGIGRVYFGQIDDDEEKVRISLVRCESRSACGIKEAIGHLKPKAVISVGFCAGLKSNNTKLGDVVISAKLITYDEREVVNDEQQWDGVASPVSKNIGDVIRYAADGWKAPLVEPDTYDVNVHCHAKILTGSKVVNSPGQSKELLERFPGAVAIEPEGSGLFEAATETGIEWVIIKGISHFADSSDGGTDEWRRFASVMAASVVQHIVKEPDVLKNWSRYKSNICC